MSAKHLTVRVQAPEGVIFETECFGISSQNLIGPFDVLFDHENYITPINKPVKILNDDYTVIRELPMVMAVLYVENNLVTIYAIISPLISMSER
jgi:F0F1-type ATP synthase epsilon subunit